MRMTFARSPRAEIDAADFERDGGFPSLN